MTTKTKSENTSTTTIDNKTNNKALFGPLGKYAIAGVIMVSIIITTGIMLDKQIGTASEQIVTIEKELADLNTSESTASIDPTSAIQSENNQIQDSIEVAKVEVTPVKAEAAVQAPVIPADDAKELVAIETTAKNTASTAQVATIEPAKAETVVINTAKTPLPQLVAYNQDQQWQTRIQTHKVEQKQRMSEMFSRIKLLESKHLDQYKIRQDEQIEHLREQIVRQQELIEELILRNKKSFEMREASMQRHQTNREEMLNRI